MHGSDQTDAPPAGASADALDWFARSRAALLLVWAIYAVPRIAVLLIDVVPTSDAAWYFERADELARGLGYVNNEGQATAFWPVGWPLALSAVFRLLGASMATVGLFNLGCALLSGWLVLDLARRVGGSELAARGALLLLAVYPNSIGYVPLALTEVFYTTLLLAGCWLLVTGQTAPRLVLAGLIFGFSMLVKAQSLIVVPLVFAIAVLRGPGFWRLLPGAAARMALLLAVAGLAVVPWTLRNHRELGAWVTVSTNGGFTLLTGNNDSARGDYTPDDPAVEALLARKLGEVATDAEAKRMGLEWIEANPGRFVAMMPAKAARLWLPDGEAMWGFESGAPAFAAHRHLFWGLRYLNQAYYVLLMLGFTAAFFAQAVTRRRAGQRLVDWWLLPYGIAAYPTVIALVFSGQSRFHYPVMPFVCMSCAWLVVTLATRDRESPTSA